MSDTKKLSAQPVEAERYVKRALDELERLPQFIQGKLEDKIGGSCISELKGGLMNMLNGAYVWCESGSLCVSFQRGGGGGMVHEQGMMLQDRESIDKFLTLMRLQARTLAGDVSYGSERRRRAGDGMT